MGLSNMTKEERTKVSKNMEKLHEELVNIWIQKQAERSFCQIYRRKRDIDDETELAMAAEWPEHRSPRVRGFLKEETN